MLIRSLVLLLVLASAGTQAQLKPPADMGGTPAPSLNATEAPPSLAKEAAAARAAFDWLTLIDNAEYGKAWDVTAAVFRERVPRQQWVDGLPKNRAEFGPLKTRRLDKTAYRESIPGAPKGEFVTVQFQTEFEKNAKGEELVTMFLDSGTWRPIGYLLR